MINPGAFQQYISNDDHGTVDTGYTKNCRHVDNYQEGKELSWRRKEEVGNKRCFKHSLKHQIW